MSKRIRQYIGIFTAVIAYYIVHEGAHLVAALHVCFSSDFLLEDANPWRSE